MRISISILTYLTLGFALTNGAIYGQDNQQRRRIPPWAEAMRAASREVSDADIELTVARGDTNKDGKLSKDDRLQRLLSTNFDRFDTNSDGVLDKEELKKSGYRPLSGRLFLEVFDKDKDGHLTKDEAIHPAMRAFDRRDRDGNGKLDEAELDSIRGGSLPSGRGSFDAGNAGRGFFNRLSPLERALELDSDGDGKLSMKESTHAMRSVFAELDEDEDGLVTKHELQSKSRLLSQCRLIDSVLTRYDTNDDGMFSKEEVKDHAILSLRFEEFDGNSDGVINGSECVAKYALMPLVNFVSFFHRLDGNNDGEITSEESNRNGFMARRFNDFDKNNDGIVSMEELASLTPEDLRFGATANSEGGARSFGPERFAIAMLQRLDANDDGKVSKEEFEEARFLSRTATFAESDADADGFLTTEELSTAVEKLRGQFLRNRTANQRLGPPSVLFRRTDTNEDGFVDMDEATEVIKEYFGVYDVNSDGKISLDEMRERAGLVAHHRSEKRTGRRLIGVGFANGREKAGLEIVRLTPGAPADIAGIKIGDHLLSANGKELSDSSDLREVINDAAEELKIGIQRGEQKLEVHVKLHPIAD